MVMEASEQMRTGVYVAPLTIQKGHTRSKSSTSSNQKGSTSSRSSSHPATRSSAGLSQITPPTTPNSSQEDLSRPMEPPQQQVFHNFLRAFYPFRPTYTVSDSTVTLPLNEGDVILVHSIHTNGWADGTLLASGARGWLPTNYCEAYEPEAMRNLLQALLNFWDLLRSGMNIDSEVFGNQEFMRGIIAGVRYLLEKSQCLVKEAPVLQANDLLRKNRKGLLSELSSLVKAAKRLQEHTTQPATQAESDLANDLVDEMILKAFKIVIKGVKFVDTLEEDIRNRAPVHKVMATVVEEAYNPPTPPAESTSFDGAQQGHSAYDAASRRSSSHSTGSGVSRSQSEEQTNRHSQYKRASTAYSSTTSSSTRPLSTSMSRPTSLIVRRQSLISHRMSLTASIPAAQRQNLVSERLNASHDTFLSYLGSFIGRLHLQSQSSSELLITIRQSVTAGRALLAVVTVVCEHDAQSADALEKPRNAMYDQIHKLVMAARDIIKASSEGDDEDVVMPHQNGPLLVAATDCVKAAGECVAKTKFVVERIGDFEFEPRGLSVHTESTEVSIDVNPVSSAPAAGEIEIPPEPTSRPPPPPLIIPAYEKPLPDVPLSSPSEVPHLSAVTDASSTDSHRNSQLLPPLPKMTSPFMSQDDYSPSDRSTSNDSEFQPPFRPGSVAHSNNGTYSSGMRDSETSLVSQTSTRATTPDIGPKAKLSISELSNAGSQSTVADDAEVGESKMLEKTFAHELLHNKDGQITGGTLPALVERMTTHDSTPDATFVATFYLTFRLFATPIELAKALVDRFEYVGESPHIAAPVRLRVYNVFKGWLESHWRDSSDREALTIIEPFAKEQLSTVLPAAGRRVLELAQKVTSTDGPIVPRLMSSLGKTSASVSQSVSADAPLPLPILTKSQASSLKNWKMGGSNPSILEFDPLEIARQLTIKEMNIFCAILPEELLGSEWTKRSGCNAPNVRAMSTLSTDLSNLVADTILHYDDAKKRAVVIKHWIKIASRCLELNNYDSLMAIICSLNSSTIIRLKKTWEVVSVRRKEVLKGLQAIVEPDKNYAVLRRRLSSHVSPCLPFVGTYLTDLTFVDAGNPSTKQLPGAGIEVVNFDKHMRTAKIIGEVQRFQIPYRLQEVPELQEWLGGQIGRVRSGTNEGGEGGVWGFYRKSLLLEPREARGIPAMSPVVEKGEGRERWEVFHWGHRGEKDKERTERSGSISGVSSGGV